MVSALLILVAALSSELYLNTVLTHWIEQRTERDLIAHARSIREMMLLETGLDNIAHLQPRIERLGQATSTRITIINDQGRVLADSGMDAALVARAENHASRPEVVTALHDGTGASIRFSTSTHEEMMKVAVRYQRPDGTGVVRVEVALESVGKNIHRIHNFLKVGTLIGVLLALAISGVISHLLTRTLRRLVQHSHEVANSVRGFNAPEEQKLGDEIYGLAGSFNQIVHELNRSIDMLAHERNRLGTVLEGMSDAVFALDGEHKISLVNWAALAMTPNENPLLGLTLEEALPNVPEVKRLGEAIQNGKSLTTELAITNPERRHLLAKATPNSAIGGGVVVMSDITEIHRLMRLRQEFAANVSHELRTPVSVIMANAEVLRDGALQDPEVAGPMLDSMARNAERLGQIISGLLELSRLDAGRYELNLQRVDLHELVHQIAASLRLPMSSKEIACDCAMPEQCAVLGDPDAVERVLANLLDNAVKYLPTTGGRIKVSASVEGNRIRVNVEDNGHGIPEEHRNRIFERFYRVDKGRSRHLGGTGLGLAIAKNFVISMGGEIGVEPVTPTGARFWFTLPVSKQ